LKLGSARIEKLFSFFIFILLYRLNKYLNNYHIDIYIFYFN